MSAYVSFDDVPLEFASSTKTTQRIQRAQFGDGYTQVLTDGLNAVRENWSCKTTVMPEEELYSLESYLLSLNGQVITWTPPNNQKQFARPVVAGQLKLGYTNLATLVLSGYTRPANYTVDMYSGIITSVNIPNDTIVQVTLTLAARTYLLGDGWEIQPAFPGYASMSFDLVQVYV